MFGNRRGDETRPQPLDPSYCCGPHVRPWTDCPGHDQIKTLLSRVARFSAQAGRCKEDYMSSYKFVFGCTFFLASCSSLPPDMEVDWKNGAKHAWVVKSYESASSPSDLPRCLASLEKKEFAARNFVQVRYHHGRRMIYEVVELPAGLQAGVDEELEIWPEDCTKGKLSRMSRILRRNKS